MLLKLTIWSKKVLKTKKMLNKRLGYSSLDEIQNLNLKTAAICTCTLEMMLGRLEPNSLGWLRVRNKGDKTGCKAALNLSIL